MELGIMISLQQMALGTYRDLILVASGFAMNIAPGFLGTWFLNWTDATKLAVAQQNV